jgi:hypothetical protein
VILSQETGLSQTHGVHCTRIGDLSKPGRDCEIHQHEHLIYAVIICYIRMIVFVDIIQILMFYNAISFSHQFPDEFMTCAS